MLKLEIGLGLGLGSVIRLFDTCYVSHVSAFGGAKSGMQRMSTDYRVRVSNSYSGPP